MAQNYVVMARKNLLKPSEAPKYYAVARSGRKVTVKEEYRSDGRSGEFPHES